jgi:hypothetical protein
LMEGSSVDLGFPACAFADPITPSWVAAMVSAAAPTKQRRMGNDPYRLVPPRTRTGFNLIHSRHVEFAEPGIPDEVPRSFFVETRFRF